MDILGMGKIKTIAIGIAVIVAIFLAGFGFGYYKAPTKIVTQTQVEYKDSEPKVVTKTETQTEVQYVEKTSPVDSDIEVENTAPKVTINGKQYRMEKLPDEVNKFDKGKVTVQQGYSIKIDAKDIIPKTPKWGFDVGYSNHGVKTGIEYNFNKNLAAYVEGTPVPPENKDRFLGAGIRGRF